MHKEYYTILLSFARKYQFLLPIVPKCSFASAEKQNGKFQNGNEWLILVNVVVCENKEFLLELVKCVEQFQIEGVDFL